MDGERGRRCSDDPLRFRRDSCWPVARLERLARLQHSEARKEGAINTKELEDLKTRIIMNRLQNDPKGKTVEQLAEHFKKGSERESVKSCILRGFPKGAISAPSAARTAHSRQNGR